MGEPFARPNEGFRFKMGGMKTNAVPDSLPPDKYPILVNVRSVTGSSLQTRPGQVLKFATGGNPVTDMRAYSALSTDNLPRILARDSIDRIYLDNGTLVGTLAGGGASPGATLIPFRPNQSPNPYMYIANGSDFQKFSAPAANVVTAQKVGIKEPQESPEVCPDSFNFTEFTNLAAQWTQTGTAGALTDVSRSADTAVAIFQDPASVSPSTSVRYSVQVTSTPAGGGGVVYDDWTAGLAHPNGDLIVPSVGNPGNFIFQALVDPGAVNQNPHSGAIEPVWPQSFGGVVGDGSQGLVWQNTGLTGVSAGGGSGGSSIQYQTGETVSLVSTAGGSFVCVVQDVPPPIAVTGLLVASIYYYSGSTGRCVVVPTLLQGADTESSIFIDQMISSLRRGALVKIGTEVCMVLCAVLGPSGTISIEVSTTSTHSAGEAFTGVPCIVVAGIDSTVVGQVLTAAAINSACTTGIATVTQTLTINPFTALMSPALVEPQQNDYVHISMNISDLTHLTEAKILIDIDDGSFTKNYYYYTFRPQDLVLAISNTQTQLATAQIVAQRNLIDNMGLGLGDDRQFMTRLGDDGPIERPLPLSGTDTFSSGQTSAGVSQWSEIIFPIAAFTRVGNDETRTLAQMKYVQILLNLSGNVTLKFGSLWVGGGGQSDVGDIGAPYMYRVRPRSSVTGAKGNPSPATRYGVNPRRQQVVITLPSAAYDSQIDEWDIFRYGGTVTSWRYVGSTPSSNATFVDNYFDDAVGRGDALEFDNHQPWPSVGLPNNSTATSVTGTTAIVTSTDTTILSYLPGTLVQLGGRDVYTLRSRPTLISGSSYLLQFNENANTGTSIPFRIDEPIVANQMLPYMWGPDADGTMFAVGDQLRPGTLSFSKNYSPDSAPDSYNQEITTPTEPLLGGEVVDGLSFVASSEHWWALIPGSNKPGQRYTARQEPLSRGLAAPWGVCTDGRSIFWWAKDGIQSSQFGSLTDADLYNLFPHEGVLGVAVTYAGTTIQPPDYSRAGTFRLVYSNGYIYAIYQDSSAVYHCLILDMKNMAWSLDVYTPSIACAYHPEQQAGTLQTSTLRYDELLYGTSDGRVATQTVNTNDLGGTIACVAACPEFDGGDIRAPKQWGDLFLDCVPNAIAGVIANPLSIGASMATPTTVVSGISRSRNPISVGGVVVSDFLGLLLTWTDDFTQQSNPTQINIWQPSFTIQPARTIGYKTFGSSFNLKQPGHIGAIDIPIVSTVDVTLTITTYDGMSPDPIVIPSTGGVFKKLYFRPTANKGDLFIFAFTSTASFQIFLDDMEIYVGEWGRTGEYSIHKDLGQKVVNYAAV